MRLRDPVPPDRDGSFARERGSAPSLPVAIGVAAGLLILLVGLVLLLV
jgi:hypothetical protein